MYDQWVLTSPTPVGLWPLPQNLIPKVPVIEASIPSYDLQQRVDLLDISLSQCLPSFSPLDSSIDRRITSMTIPYAKE